MPSKPDSSKVAFGCADNTVRAIDPLTGKQVVQMGTHSDWVLGTVFSRDDILNHLRGHEADLYTRAVDIVVSRLHKKTKLISC